VIECLPISRDEVQIFSGARQRDQIVGAIDDVDAVVIGPGPLDPKRAGLIDLARLCGERRLPTLGVCLGHQAIGMAFGAELEAVEPRHGSRSDVRFRRSRFFGLSDETVPVMRYHSLALRAVSSPLEVVAETDDGIAMAVEHQSLPMAGLQFHPDSFATPAGAQMVAAFFSATR